MNYSSLRTEKANPALPLGDSKEAEARSQGRCYVYNRKERFSALRIEPTDGSVELSPLYMDLPNKAFVKSVGIILFFSSFDVYIRGSNLEKLIDDLDQNWVSKIWANGDVFAADNDNQSGHSPDKPIITDIEVDYKDKEMARKIEQFKAQSGIH